MIILSPSKRMFLDKAMRGEKVDTPRFGKQTRELLFYLRVMDPDEIKVVLKVSEALAQEICRRYQDEIVFPGSQKSLTAAIRQFAGDAYVSLGASSLGPNELGFLRRCLRILSGLYGYLAPFDGIGPYRLNMGTELPNSAGLDLYDLWLPLLAPALADEMEKANDRLLLNLASVEYAKAMDFNLLRQRGIETVDVAFVEIVDGKARVNGFDAKRRRGAMTRHLAMRGDDSVESAKTFRSDGYAFDPERSTPGKLVFSRVRR